MTKVLQLHLDYFTEENMKKGFEEFLTQLGTDDVNLGFQPAFSMEMKKASSRRLSLGSKKPTIVDRKALTTSGNRSILNSTTEDLAEDTLNTNTFPVFEPLVKPYRVPNFKSTAEAELELVMEYIKGKLFTCNQELSHLLRAHLRKLTEILQLDRTRGYKGELFCI